MTAFPGSSAESGSALPDRVGAGRYAPSPTGELHLGNLRTALLAWLFARSTGRRFLLRIEDLDAARVRPGMAEQQLADLTALGVTYDAEPVVQSERLAAYQDALKVLAPTTYECFCSRREIARRPRRRTTSLPNIHGAKLQTPTLQGRDIPAPAEISPLLSARVAR